MGQMTTGDVKEAICSDESSPDSAVSFLEHFSIFRLIVLVSSTRLYCFFSPLSLLSSTLFPVIFSEKSSKNPPYSRQAQWATSWWTWWSISAAKEPDISLRSQWGPTVAKRRVNIGFIRWTETRLQINANVALCLLVSVVFTVCSVFPKWPKKTINAALKISHNTMKGSKLYYK